MNAFNAMNELKTAMNNTVENIIMERNKTINSMIFGEIQQIATENGFDTKIVINEKAVIEAFKKRTPQKVIPFCNSGIAMACPECGTFQDFVDEATLNDRSPYCYKCGQALDWSDYPTKKGGE